MNKICQHGKFSYLKFKKVTDDDGAGYEAVLVEPSLQTGEFNFFSNKYFFIKTNVVMGRIHPGRHIL